MSDATPDECMDIVTRQCMRIRARWRRWLRSLRREPWPRQARFAGPANARALRWFSSFAKWSVRACVIGSKRALRAPRLIASAHNLSPRACRVWALSGHYFLQVRSNTVRPSSITRAFMIMRECENQLEVFISKSPSPGTFAAIHVSPSTAA